MYIEGFSPDDGYHWVFYISSDRQTVACMMIWDGVFH